MPPVNLIVPVQKFLPSTRFSQSKYSSQSTYSLQSSYSSEATYSYQGDSISNHGEKYQQQKMEIFTKKVKSIGRFGNKNIFFLLFFLWFFTFFVNKKKT